MWLTGWYPVYLREILLFRRKFLRPGYLVSAALVPLLYLGVFGLGLGRSVRLGSGDYLSFLLPGLIAMTSMTNSYAWVASALCLNRLHTKTFQLLIQAPVSAAAIMVGEVLAGMTKGLFAAAILIGMGLCLSRPFRVTPLVIAATLSNSCLFASLGVITGLLARSHEETSTYNNFLILPMAFFSGTFFPLDDLPAVLKGIVLLLPLSQTTLLMRREVVDGTAVCALLAIAAYTCLFLLVGIRRIQRYSE
jgi:ABC-type multidrug transport system permease subunit